MKARKLNRAVTAFIHMDQDPGYTPVLMCVHLIWWFHRDIENREMSLLLVWRHP